MHDPLVPVQEPALPDTVEACHAMIRRLEHDLTEVRRKLAVHEENQRREWEQQYGRGVTPQSLLNVGLLVAGKGGVVRSRDPNDPTCGELLERARATKREERKRQRQLRKQNQQGLV